jgi:hypothetical protein
MGVSPFINYEKYPNQGNLLNCRVRVCYEFDSSKVHEGVVIRDDLGRPGLTIIKLDNDRVLLSSECQFSPIK